MIRRVYEQAEKAKLLDLVYVATDDERIKNNIELFGGNVIMTSGEHRTGTDRCIEAFKNISSLNPDIDFHAVINIQGDEPFIDPAEIDKVAACFSDSNIQIASLAKRTVNADEINDPNVVKVVINTQSKALYFSRLAIPYNKSAENPVAHHKHIGIYGFRAAILDDLARLPESMLEKAESLEQLRWLDYGYSIHIKLTDKESISVDTPDDLLKFANIT